MSGRNDRQLSFSAHSLQAYVDCARRFELRYLEQLKWPAVASEPLLESERHLVDGRRLHEMIHRDVLGLKVTEPNAGAADGADIARWWRHYKDRQPAGTAGERFAEQTLVGVIGGNTVVATCDLIVLDHGGRARIFDWKTWRRRHTQEWLAQRLQTRIYPWLLARTGGVLTDGEPPAADAIEMIYWYADFPDDPEVFAYSEAQLDEDEAYLGGLVAEILTRGAGEFPLTGDDRKCAHCVYRSYCDRGGAAGRLDESDLDGEEEGAGLLPDLDDYEAVAF